MGGEVTTEGNVCHGRISALRGINYAPQNSAILVSSVPFMGSADERASRATEPRHFSVCTVLVLVRTVPYCTLSPRWTLIPYVPVL